MASDKVLNRKKDIVKEIENTIENNEALILFDYRGLTDFQIKEIRRDLKENNDDYKVYKNTLLKIAFKNKGIDLDHVLEGPSALAFGKDQISAVKVLTKHAKNTKILTLKAGYIDNEVADLEKLKLLSTVPGRQELLTMVAGGMIGLVRDLAIGLDLVSKQKEN